MVYGIVGGAKSGSDNSIIMSGGVVLILKLGGVVNADDGVLLIWKLRGVVVALNGNVVGGHWGSGHYETEISGRGLKRK